jgi:hypothetical protein
MSAVIVGFFSQSPPLAAAFTQVYPRSSPPCGICGKKVFDRPPVENSPSFRQFRQEGGRFRQKILHQELTDQGFIYSQKKVFDRFSTIWVMFSTGYLQASSYSNRLTWINWRYIDRSGAWDKCGRRIYRRRFWDNGGWP